MTIDEEIEKHRKIAETKKTLYDACILKEYNRHLLREYKEHEQLAEWLEELKTIKNGFTDDLLNMGYTKGYRKAIDDFNCYVQHEESIGNIKSLDDYDRIAEKLKAGVKNENF